MANKPAEGIPQIVAVVQIAPDGRLSLKKAVREHLGLGDQHVLYLDMQAEILLSAASVGDELVVDEKNRIHLPKAALTRLGIAERSLVGLVQRDSALAIKRVEINEREGECARLYDRETTDKIERWAETNPMPDVLLPRVKALYRGLALRHNVRGFLQGRQTLEAWQARGMLDISEAGDEALQERLIGERLEKQGKDGSWAGRATIAARNLRELADLGMTTDDISIRRAVDWLMDRAQSAYNPGMWFATDELVQEQSEVIKRREAHTGRGPRERFNQRKALEVNLVKDGDDLVAWPCGPRITWTTALILEALLKLGCERADRVQTALQTLTTIRWCDNAQQHGLSRGGERGCAEPYSMDEIEAMEQAYIQRYRYGGIRSPKELRTADTSHVPFYLPRVAHNQAAGADEYPLRMPGAGGGCEVITARALSLTTDHKLRRLAQAHLWEYVGEQRAADGSFAGYSDKTFADPQALFMQLLARYDHPAAKVGLWRSLPWIVDHQNEDGSWGQGVLKDVSTLSILEALLSLGGDLPAGMRP